MKIQDIQNKEFSKSILGYDCREVDTFLDLVIDRMTEYEKEKKEMLTALEYLLKELEKAEKKRKKRKTDPAENKGKERKKENGYGQEEPSVEEILKEMDSFADGLDDSVPAPEKRDTYDIPDFLLQTVAASEIQNAIDNESASEPESTVPEASEATEQIGDVSETEESVKEPEEEVPEDPVHTEETEEHEKHENHEIPAFLR